MFSKKTLNEFKALMEQWQRHSSAQYEKSEFEEKTTSSGIKLKPVYTPNDIKDIGPKDIGLPGEYPYTRSTNLRGYQDVPWMMSQTIGFGGGENSRKRWEFLRKSGMRERIGGEEQIMRLNLTVDSPTWCGYDPDDPPSRGRIGGCGVSISTLEDMELLLGGLPLEKIRITFIVQDTTMAVAALYITYAERRGYNQKDLLLADSNQLYRQWHCGEAAFPPEAAMKLLVEYINYRVKHMPQGRYLLVPGYNVGEAGATPVQELAFSLLTAMATAEECVRAKLDLDDVLPGFTYHCNIGPDFFEAIAKIRAYRRMWAKIFKERFDCKAPKALKVSIHAHDSGAALTAQEPLNNIVRTTLGTLAGVLSDVDSLTPCAYDEALGLPTEEASRISLTTQLIIYHETGIPSVVDPLGGSYYVEWLTNKIEEEAWKLIEKVGKLGGFMKCWKSGWLRAEIERSAYEWHDGLASGRNTKVGVNKYCIENDHKEMSVFEGDPELEEVVIERVRRFKTKRDNAKIKNVLDRLKGTTKEFIENWPRSCGILMPAILNAARADATVGEIQIILREVCGYGYFP